METRKSMSWMDGVYQITAACIAHSIAIQSGINMAFSTILLPQVMEPQNLTLGNSTEWIERGLHINKDQASWVASLVTISTPVGSLLTGSLMDWFGRKTICAAAALPFLVSWTLVAFTTTNVYTLYAARIFAGVGGGLTTAAMVYVSEISHASIRPMLLSLTSVVVSLGILLTTGLGYFLPWRTVAVCCGVAAAASFVGILFLPESPSWFVGKRKTKAGEALSRNLTLAGRSLRWLVRNEDEFNREYARLVDIKEKRESQKRGRLYEEERSTQYQRTNIVKPLCILQMLFLLQQFSGGYVVIFYAAQIFEQIGSVILDQFTCVFILGAIRFIMAVVSVFLSKRFGRKPLLISSSLGTATFLFCAAAYLHFFGPGLVPSLLLLLFVLCSSYGVLVIPWTLIGEILPLRVRATGSGFLVAAAYVLMFFTVKFFITALDWMGVVMVLTVFAVFSLLMAAFAYFFLPETLGKSFEEIEKHFL